MENKTHWKKLVNPDYLGAYSLQPKEEKILTIAKITREKVVGSGGKKTESTVAHFKEPDVKPMILNRTNCKVIARVYKTNFIEDWVGKKIQIFAEIVDAFGDQVEALRIKPFMPSSGEPLKIEAILSIEDLKTLFELKKDKLSEKETSAIERVITNKEEKSYQKIQTFLTSK